MAIHQKPPRGAGVAGGGSAAAFQSQRERDTDYAGVLIQLTTTRRIILGKDGGQYILQKMFDETAHGAVWRGESYHVTRDSLIAACVRSEGLCEGDPILALLQALPSCASAADVAARLALTLSVASKCPGGEGDTPVLGHDSVALANGVEVTHD